MTAPALEKDKIIPCYFNRGICFDLPLTGASVIKNLLQNINPLADQQILTNPNVLQYSFSSFKEIKPILSKIRTIEVLTLHIKGKISLLNQQIQHYEDFLKFRTFFIKQKRIHSDIK